ncbi:ISL3 family transposase [Stutzerimonas balearica]|uniref:Transposase n=3 Tax=Stutzerimonas balearica TaxID=74829 RepID=A0A8D3Y2L2_9GAMM|nr:ISL3 family transposase [Stutzerimonas balearica]AJE16164.1 transposase [Stutzerimonas balearica DSM 6083]MBC7199623.1 ISL3 family transposase [Stutzerimonas balearica]MBK3746277.1 ISL3 family transposase [Stutzerimonas balearica]MBK3747193.1 ISL3 family transposase [Stutzerimonas balearica]MBK3748932.1 ISL3 family transposase [Stutzerimonas balearica]
MHDVNTFLPFWEGFSVIGIRPDGEALLIDLIPNPSRFPTCSGCHQPSTTIHEYCQRSIRDLPILGRSVRLNVELRRVECGACGKRMESVSWLDRYSRMTRRLAEAVTQACRRLPTLHVAELFGLHWDSVRLLERRALQAALEKLPKAQPKRLVMDEFALFKGHRYASVVLDADTRRVLWIGEGRSRAAIRPFFEELGPEGCARIEAVAMDMNTAFDLEVRQHCPQARVVYDLFHVVAKYGREVIDRVRVDEANRLRHDKPARKVIKQARWLLLRNPENLKREEQQLRLQDLLAANQSLMTVYLMKAELKTLWSPTTAWGWRSAWKQWLRLAGESEIPALKQFAKRLRGYWRGILSRVRWPMHTGQLEGINNRIKVIKRMAYGYRDSEFFFMKIKNNFPGNP